MNHHIVVAAEQYGGFVVGPASSSSSSSSTPTPSNVAFETASANNNNRHQHRQLQNNNLPNPFAPNYLTQSCHNSQPAEPWQEYTTLPKTPKECCETYFNWVQDGVCVQGTMEWIFSNQGGEVNNANKGPSAAASAGGGDVVVEYYLDTTDAKCKRNNSDQLSPSWLITQLLFTNWDTCCEASWDVVACRLDSMEQQSTTTANDGTMPKQPQQQMVAATSSSAEQDTYCRPFNRKQCLRNSSSCTWNQSCQAKDNNTNTQLNINNNGAGSATSTTSCEMYREDKTKCINAAECVWKRRGCRMAENSESTTTTTTATLDSKNPLSVMTNQVGNVGDNIGSSGNSVNTNADPCTILGYGECNSSPSCMWHTTYPGTCRLTDTSLHSTTATTTNASATNGVANNKPSPSISSNSNNCQFYTKTQCQTQSQSCVWNKKLKCLPIMDIIIDQSTTLDDNNVVDTPRPTKAPTPPPPPTTPQYYLDTGNGKCKLNSYARPNWLNQLYTDWTSCCNDSWDRSGCLTDMQHQQGGGSSNGVNTNNGGSSSTNNNDPPIVIEGDTTLITIEWYYDSGNGGCKPNNSEKPSWLVSSQVLFDTVDSCCAISWNVPKCLQPYIINDRGEEVNNGNPCSGSKGCSIITTNRNEWDDGTTPPIFIDLTIYGMLEIDNLGTLPQPTSGQWNKMKRVFTKSIILTFTSWSGWVHPDMEVELWSVDGTNFVWRRQRRALLSSQGVGDGAEVVIEKEEKELGGNGENKALPSSSLRGAQVKILQPQQPTLEQGRQRRTASSSSPVQLKFELIIPTKCYSKCQSDNSKLMGKQPFTAINEHFQTAITDGEFSIQLKTAGESMGLFRNAYPTVNGGELELTYSTPSNGRDDMTWNPSKSPTYHPTEVTAMPTDDIIYYPDFSQTVCKTGNGHSEFNIYFFGSIESCCNFPWMKNYDECLENSKEVVYMASLPTKRPTPRPTPKPTREPVVRKTKRPTSSPTKRQPGPTQEEQAVYYPDLNLGVCKFDGRHGNNPYQFSTPQACCTNQWMEYTKCMAYADPYYGLPTSTTKYYPDIYAGYCKSDGGHVGLDDNLVYDSPEKCCDNIWMNYQSCMMKSRDPPNDSTGGTNTGTLPTGSNVVPQSTLVPTPKPTKKNVDPNTITGSFYPDFDADLCVNDGNHADEPYVFDTLGSCCSNQIMDYDYCVSYSLEYNDDGSGTGTGTMEYDGCFWFPDPVQFGTCTYSADYPEIWTAPDKRDDYLFGTHDDCCVGAFGGTNCGSNYDCNGEQSGMTPTGFVTEPPSTYYPTFNPTGGPGNSGGSGKNGGGGGNPSGSTNNDPPPTPATTKPTPNPTPLPTPKPVALAATPKPTPKPAPDIPSNTYTDRPTVKFTLPPVVTTAIDATTLVSEISDSFENGLTGGFPWHTSPNLPWSTYQNDKTDGSFSARSHPVEPGENSDLHVAIKSNHGGVLYFDFKTDVKMPFSGCYINIDGQSKKGYTFPKPDWIPMSLPIPEGDHVVMFRAWAPNLVKPETDPGVSGTIGVDNVSFMPKLFEGFEAGELEWNTVKFKGSGQWSFDNTKAHDGSVSLKSPSLMPKESSSMEFEVTIPRRGADINFWYFPNVGRGKFAFKINNKAVVDVNKSESAWKQFTKALPPGTYKLEWEYSKDSTGEGGVWIDDIGIVGK